MVSSPDSVEKECDNMSKESVEASSEKEKVPGLVFYELVADIKRELDDVEKQLEPVLRPTLPINKGVDPVSNSPAVEALQQILNRVEGIYRRISL
jgi:hypothetical protein